MLLIDPFRTVRLSLRSVHRVVKPCPRRRNDAARCYLLGQPDFRFRSFCLVYHVRVRSLGTGPGTRIGRHGTRQFCRSSAGARAG